MTKKNKDKTLLQRFIGPMIIGFAIGLICMFLKLEVPVRFLYTISQNFVQLLTFIAPIMVLIYTISGVNQIKGDAKKFFLKFIGLVFITLLVIGMISLLIAKGLVPHVLFELKAEELQTLKPYFVIDMKPLFTTTIGVLLGIMFGVFLPQDSLTMKLVKEGEDWIGNFARGFLLPIMPIWIIGVFAKSAYVSTAGSLFINDLILSTIILIVQALWLAAMYFVATKLTKRSSKKALYAGAKLYIKVTSIMGMGTGIIIPFAIEAQKEIDVDESVAKIVSASSLNMPGSMISNVIFAYGVVIMCGLSVTNMQMLTYSFALIFATMIAPSIPGGVFSVTSSLLTPILGFNADQIGLMGALYYTQGTSNSATNNAADVYLGPLLDSKPKV